MSQASSVPASIKREILQTAKELSKLKINPLTYGNISARDPLTGLIVITPHDLPYRTMTESDLVVIDVHGNRKEGHRMPSNESPVHCVVYRERLDINGIVHSEPVFANAFGTLRMAIPPIYVNMAIDVGGAVPVMDFADSGNEDFAYEMLKIMGRFRAVIWANHGLLTLGATLNAAFHCTITVELAAEMYHVALSHGQPIAISETKLRSLKG